MKKTPFIALLAVSSLMAAFSACDDAVSNIGASLSEDEVEIVIDSAFTLSGKSVPLEAIRPKTTTQMLGRIVMPSYGTMESSVVAQFLPSVQLDTANFGPENVDSIVLTLRYATDAIIGDSVAPMGLRVYALNKQLPPKLQSDFDPAGYYDPSAPMASAVFNATSMGVDSIAALNYRDIRFRLPQQLGRRLFQDFIDNPANYANGKVFANNVFPGIYLQNSYGSGRLTQVSRTYMSMYLRKIEYNEDEKKLDTISATHLYYMVTPEVQCNNNLSISLSSGISEKVEQGKTMMVAPLGYDIEFEFPAQKVINSFRGIDKASGVINSLTMSIPADSLENSDGVTAPPYALLVLKKDRESFFSENRLPDDVTSFYATYDSSNQRYYFGGLRAYIADLMEKETITPEDYTFCLIPVQVNFENTAGNNYYYYGGTQSQVESEVLPYVLSPVVADVRLADAKIKLTYSLQTQK